MQYKADGYILVYAELSNQYAMTSQRVSEQYKTVKQAWQLVGEDA